MPDFRRGAGENCWRCFPRGGSYGAKQPTVHPVLAQWLRVCPRREVGKKAGKGAGMGRGCPLGTVGRASIGRLQGGRGIMSSAVASVGGGRVGSAPP